VLVPGELRAAAGGVEVGVGDRLAPDPHLLALHRDGLGGLPGGGVPAQPHPAPPAGLGADRQLLLGAGHGLVGGRPGGVPAHGAVLDVVDAVVITVALPGGQAAVGAGLGVAEAVVAGQLGLLVLGGSRRPAGWGRR
jgi:hypothetical protein